LLVDTPSNSGALSVMPARPARRTNQTWITGTPRARQRSASRRMFSMRSARGSAAGEPEAAKAPPSITTSFCMSWMISAQRERRAAAAVAARSPGRDACGRGRRARRA
jgi:hypothetical protein